MSKTSPEPTCWRWAARSNDDVFNVGTGSADEPAGAVPRLLRLTGSNLQPEHREARKVGNVQRRRAATEKAAEVLGFTAEVSLEQGLRELIRWRQGLKSAAAAVEA